MDGKKNTEKRRAMCFLIVGIAAVTAVTATLFSLFGALFRYKAQSFLWPLAISFLIVALISWIIPALDKLPAKRQKLIRIYRIVFTVIGGVLFIINSFLFIDDTIYSFMLITIVLCLFVGLIFLQLAVKHGVRDND